MFNNSSWRITRNHNICARILLTLTVGASIAPLTGCGKGSADDAQPDPALSGKPSATAQAKASPPAGTANSDGSNAPASPTSVASSPPPNTNPPTGPKTPQLGTLQDMCASGIIKLGSGGVVRPFVRFIKDGKTLVVDPCLDGGAKTVSYEKFKSGKFEDLLVASQVCRTSEPCWYRILDLSQVPDSAKATLAYHTLDEMKLAGRYLTGESNEAIPSDAQYTLGLLVDDKGAPKAATKTFVSGYKPVDTSKFATKDDLTAIDGRLAKLEQSNATLLGAYSDWLRAKEAM